MWPFSKKQLPQKAVTASVVIPTIATLYEEVDSSELEQLRDRFELVRQATGDGLWDMEINQDDPTREDNPFWWSDQFRFLLGYRDERDFPNVLSSWSRLLHPDEAGPTIEAFGKHMNDRTGRTPYNVKYRLKCRDGIYRWFAARGQTMRAADGTPLRVAGSLTNIQAEVDRNLQLEKTLTRFELSREMMNDGLWDLEVISGDPVNPNNAFWWSTQFRRLLGFETEEEFPNVLDSWASRLHPEDKDRTVTAFSAHLMDRSGNTPYDIEYRCLCKDQQYRWFRAKGQTKRDRAGNPIRAVGALIDINAQKMAEKTDEQNERYSRQLDTMKEIGEIVQTIELIAQQTNLISLNAAVEAAHAGSAGRGFGVIASEIRQLSARTTDATKHIKKIQSELGTTVKPK